jgi:hypothetical protein
LDISECAWHPYSLYHRPYLPRMLGVSGGSKVNLVVCCAQCTMRQKAARKGRQIRVSGGSVGLFAYRLQQYVVCFDQGNCSCLCMCCSVDQGLVCAANATIGQTRQFWFGAQPPLRTSLVRTLPLHAAPKTVPRLLWYLHAGRLFGSCVFCVCFGIFVVWLRAPSISAAGSSSMLVLVLCHLPNHACFSSGIMHTYACTAYGPGEWYSVGGF